MTIPSEDIRFFMMLNRLKIEGRRRAVQLLGEGKAAREIHEQFKAEKLFPEMGEFSEKIFDPDREIENCFRAQIGFLAFLDPDYPACLKEIPDPPLFLYLKGKILETDRNALAIVGTRHPSFYGRTQAKRFSSELAEKGLTIVSGLARGIDQVAHEATLGISYGRTIAVLGCGLDIIYPRENASLFEKIKERGAILSEYPLGTPPLPENFPRRNRILSGLSHGVFVVEAHSRSGSLITAHQALEQGREVFALPGPVDQLTSRGTHQLLKEGAMLVESPDEILEALASRLKLENKFGSAETQKNLSIPDFAKSLISLLPFAHSSKGGHAPSQPLMKEEHVISVEETGERMKEKPVDFSDLGDEAKTIESVLKEEGPLTLDEILEFTGLDASRVPGLLLQMELMRKIKRTPEGKYCLK